MQSFFLSAVFALRLIASVLAGDGATAQEVVAQEPATQELTTQEQATRPRLVDRAAAIDAAAREEIKHGVALLQAGQFRRAEEIAARLTSENPTDAEGWKIAGFAKFGLKNYADAADALARARELQQANGVGEDRNTARALAQSLVYAQRYEQALPLLVAATDEKIETEGSDRRKVEEQSKTYEQSKTGAQSGTGAQTKTGDQTLRAELLALRGIAELRTGRAAAAEDSFNRAVRLDAKNPSALFYLGRIAYDQGQINRAIIMLNRATLSNNRFSDAWRLLTIAYLRRAAEKAAAKEGATEQSKAAAQADYLSAVRASAALLRADSSPAAGQIHAQSLIAAQQYAAAAELLEGYAARISPARLEPIALYLLGVAHSRTKNYQAAIKRLEEAAERDPDDASIQTELGFAYESTKQYAKALAAYERAASFAPDDLSLSASIARVRPFARD